MKMRFVVHALPFPNSNSEDHTLHSSPTHTHTGDPDLYVSVSNKLPTLATSDFISAGLGDELIELTTELPDVPDDLERMFFSVLGNTKSHYDVGVWVEQYAVPVRGLRGSLI